MEDTKFNKNLLKIVESSEEYWDFIRIMNYTIGNNWPIPTFKEFSDYLSLIKKDKKTEIKIALYYNNPIGYVGIIRNSINIYVHPSFQGKGVGKFMLKEILKSKISDKNTHAKIKINNNPSIKLFESLGFEKDSYIFKLKN